MAQSPSSRSEQSTETPCAGRSPGYLQRSSQGEWSDGKHAPVVARHGNVKCLTQQVLESSGKMPSSGSSTLSNQRSWSILLGFLPAAVAIIPRVPIVRTSEWSSDFFWVLYPVLNPIQQRSPEFFWSLGPPIVGVEIGLPWGRRSHAPRPTNTLFGEPGSQKIPTEKPTHRA